MAIRLASLFIRLGADSAELTREFSNTRRDARNWERDLRVVGTKAKTVFAGVAAATAGVGVAFTGIYATTAPLIDNLGKTADKLGTTTEGLQAVRAAGEKAGLAIGTVDTALQRQTRRLAEAAQGIGEARGAIAELGLDAADLSKLRPELALQRILTELDKIPNQADKVRLAFKIFDTEGVGLVNLTSASIQQASADMDALGVSLNRIDVAKVEAANDAFADIGLITRGLRNQITVSLAEPLALVAEQLFESAKQSGGFQLQLDELIKSSLSGLSSLSGGLARILTFVDGKPEIAAGGIVGYLFGGKLGFLAGTALASAAEYASTSFKYLTSLFDKSLTDVDKTILAYDRLNAKISLLQTPGIGNLVLNRDEQIEALIAERKEVEFLLVEYGEFETLGKSALQGVEGVAGNLGKAMQAVSDATRKAADEYGNFQLKTNVQPPGPGIPEIPSITVDQPQVNQPETGETAALIGEYQNYQDLRVEATLEANRQIQFATTSFFDQQAAANAQFHQTWTDFQQAGATDRFRILTRELSGSLGALGRFSKTWYKINQGVGIANAVVNTAQGVTKALASLPPPFSYIAAATTALKGAAQIALIKRTEYGTTSTPVVPSADGGSLSAAPTPATVDENAQVQQSQSVNVNIINGLFPNRDHDQVVAESMQRLSEEGIIVDSNGEPLDTTAVLPSVVNL